MTSFKNDFRALTKLATTGKKFLGTDEDIDKIGEMFLKKININVNVVKTSEIISDLQAEAVVATGKRDDYNTEAEKLKNTIKASIAETREVATEFLSYGNIGKKEHTDIMAEAAAIEKEIENI